MPFGWGKHKDEHHNLAGQPKEIQRKKNQRSAEEERQIRIRKAKDPKNKASDKDGKGKR